MKKRWIAIVGAMLLGSVLGCESGNTVTAPEEGAPPPKEGPAGAQGAATSLDVGGPAKTP